MLTIFFEIFKKKILQEERIREMAMEKKIKNEKSRNQYIKLSF